MNLIAHPELLELLAASHALGTLRGGARRRFEALAREQAPVRAAALVWPGRLASMTELQPSITPSRASSPSSASATRPTRAPPTRHSSRNKAAGCAASRSGAAPRPPARWPRCWP